MELLPKKKQRSDIYIDAFIDAVVNKKLLKAVYHGIKAARFITIDTKPLQEVLAVYDAVLACVGGLTPNQLMQIFPIKKRYDGKRWQCKDYYTSMDAANKIGMDMMIGGNEHAMDFLWDYDNDSTAEFSVNYLMAISRFQKQRGEQTPIEWFSEEYNVPVYYERTDEATGHKYLFEPKSGKTFSLKKTYPRYIKIAK